MFKFTVEIDGHTLLLPVLNLILFLASAIN